MEKEAKKTSSKTEEKKKAPSGAGKKATADKSAARSKKTTQKVESVPTEGVPEKEETRKSKTLYRVKFFYEWCKSCGICAAMCPKKIIMLNENGQPYIEDEDNCIGCRNCEIHCPDFAITVDKRYPERRKTNGVK